MIAARAAIARACLDALPSAQLNEITLRPAQRRIVARAERALRTHGGCLVGEDVGRGKTFIALALARRWSTPMIIAPAALRSTWARAQARAGVECQFASHDALSRGRLVKSGFDALIVDESHHFRNPVTARYEALAHMAANVPIVLLSATPLQNRARDLAAQVALFYGEAAFQLSAGALARFVIRGEDLESDDMPVVAPPEWLPIHADDGAVLASLLDLPPPPRPLDGGDAGALGVITLVRAWASSRAALKGMLRSRRRLATAIAQGVEAGQAPTRRETREWRAAEDVVQLGMAEMLMRHAADPDSLRVVRAQLDDEDAAYDRVRATLAATVDPDRARVAAIRALRAAHPGCRIVAFSEYASTVSAYFDTLRGDPGVGLITARYARIVTGLIPRDEILARFAPLAQGASQPAPHDGVTLLLATDLLSEGVNLQDASIVVHLDLPWNPARLAQRVGRVRRPGGAGVVRSFLVAPPARADALLAADARLRCKLEQALEVVGPSFAVLPSPASLAASGAVPPRPATNNAVVEGRLVGLLQSWAEKHPTAPAHVDVEIAAVTHSERGWLAALDDGRLVASLDGTPTEVIEPVLHAMELAGQPARDVDAVEATHASAALERWLLTEQILMDCGMGSDDGALHRKANALLRIVVTAARRHEQAVVVGLASRIRQHLATPMPLGAERATSQHLAAAVEERSGAIDLLARLAHDLDAGLRSRALDDRTPRNPRVVALILIGPASGVARPHARNVDP